MLIDATAGPAPIVLIGFMGSGKSSVARRLSRLLGMPIIDLDTEIEAEIGSSIADFFAAHGEEAFRLVETRCFARALEKMVIIATGGGVVVGAHNRAELSRARSVGAVAVYLRATPASLAARIRRQPGARPLIDGERTLSLAATTLRVGQLLAERAAFYEECADCVVDTDALSTWQVASRVAALVKKEQLAD